MEKIKSNIGFDYKTIKITQSRINKGLLAIPASLIDFFPNEKMRINIYLGDSDNAKQLSFTPYSASSKEIRIGGLARWFAESNMQSDDEIVLQVINKDKNEYRLIKEKQFVENIKSIKKEVIAEVDENKLDIEINKLTKAANLDVQQVLDNQFIELVDTEIKQRKQITTKSSAARKEQVTPFLRKLLLNIYTGKCQLTNFTFIQNSGLPYFEVHHIDDSLGNHLQNLLVVSPNIHRMFTYSRHKLYYDNDGWLRQVLFTNDNQEYQVKQYIDNITKDYFIKEVHY